jgi:hypothetical protein
MNGSSWKKNSLLLDEEHSMKDNTSNKMSIDARYRSMLVLWGGQIGSVVMFFVVTQFATLADRDANNLLSFLFAGLGTFSAIASFVIRSKLLERSVEKQDVALVQKAYTASCALCEVPALLGVVERFMLPGRDYLLLFFISGFAMALHFPRKTNLLAASYKDPSFGASL